MELSCQANPAAAAAPSLASTSNLGQWKVPAGKKAVQRGDSIVLDPRGRSLHACSRNRSPLIMITLQTETGTAISVDIRALRVRDFPAAFAAFEREEWKLIAMSTAPRILRCRWAGPRR